ncbi:MAG: DUF2784 family protein [candidate division WOR-3 bacterium]
MKNSLLLLARFVFVFHVFWVLYVIFGVFYRYPGILWDLHLFMTFGLLLGVLLNECPLTTLERYIRKKAGQKNIPNRGSRFLEVFKEITGITLPNNLMRVLGFVYFVLGLLPHLVKY